jgi:hypothetical protein
MVMAMPSNSITPSNHQITFNGKLTHPDTQADPLDKGSVLLSL